MSSNDQDRPSGAKDDFDRAVERLESAVDELVTLAKEQLSDRATAFVDDAADRLQREIDTRRRQRSTNTYLGGSRDRHRERREERREARREHREARRAARAAYANFSSTGSSGRSRRLCRDVRRQRLCGVCAGFARYFGVEPWVVRCIAVTALIFMPQIVIPAYLIACLVLEKSTDGEPADAEPIAVRRDHTSPAPELGARLSPRRSLRDVQSTFDQMELKMRRMESHVTSGQYELQRELRKIDAT